MRKAGVFTLCTPNEVSFLYWGSRAPQISGNNSRDEARRSDFDTIESVLQINPQIGDEGFTGSQSASSKTWFFLASDRIDRQKCVRADSCVTQPSSFCLLAEWREGKGCTYLPSQTAVVQIFGPQKNVTDYETRRNGGRKRFS